MPYPKWTDIASMAPVADHRIYMLLVLNCPLAVL